MSEDENQPKLKAGSKIVQGCPICKCNFQEAVATNLKHQCPNPECQEIFTVLVNN